MGDRSQSTGGSGLWPGAEPWFDGRRSRRSDGIRGCHYIDCGVPDIRALERE